MSSTNREPVIVSIEEILALLKTGVTRLNRDVHYNPERGSIQSIYGLTATEVTELFTDPRLKKKKTIVPKPSRIIIAEDQEQEEVQEDTEEITNDSPAETADEAVSYDATEQDIPQTPYMQGTDPIGDLSDMGGSIDMETVAHSTGSF